MSFSILLSLTAKLLPVSTEYAAALLSFRYPSMRAGYIFYLRFSECLLLWKIQPISVIFGIPNK